MITNPLEKLKKFRGKSWEELRTRGGQVFSAKSEQIGLSGKLPTDSELRRLFDKTHFGGREITPATMLEAFYANGASRFFPSFNHKTSTVHAFRAFFDERRARHLIDQADKIVRGKFDLLGFLNLDFGAPPDWHFEPLSKTRAPRKHWKLFDELATDETGDKKIVWELNRHQYFFYLGAAYLLTGDERYARTFGEHLANWMNENSPGVGINWFSSLEIAFRMMSWTWAFHFFKDSPHLTPELFQKAVKFLYLHGRHIEKYLSTYYSPNTHLTGEALGLYYLGTQFPFFNRAQRWRQLGEDILFGELERQILADGVYFEQTTWYQRYTADFYTHFLILKTLCGTDKADEARAAKFERKLQQMLDFLMYATRPDGTTPIIGDDDGGRMLPLTSARSDDFRGSLAVGATLFERGDYKYVAGQLSEEIVWLLGYEGAKGFQTLHAHVPHADSAAFRRGGYFIMRDGWAAGDNYLLIDCGEVGSLAGGHGHADTLAIDLAVKGKTLLVDSGTYTYHESNEARDYFRSTAAHNALTIDGKSSSDAGDKFSWKRRAAPQVHSWIAQDRFDFFEGAHDGFSGAGVTDYRRSILFLKNDYWIMRDYVEARGEHDYALNFHLNSGVLASLEAAADGRLCAGETDSGAFGGWRIFTFGDNGVWQKKESWMSNLYGRKMNAPFLRFASKGREAQEFFTFMIPAEKNFAKPEIFESFVAGGRAFVIKYRDYTDLFLFADPNGENLLRTDMFTTNFQFFWARISRGELLPEEFVMIGGSRFAIRNREIINHPAQLEYASARRLGNALNVKTNENLYSILLDKIPDSKFQTPNP